MNCGPHRDQRGSALVEAVSVTVAVALLLAGVGQLLGRRDPLSEPVSQRLLAAVDGTSRSDTEGRSLQGVRRSTASAPRSGTPLDASFDGSGEHLIRTGDDGETANARLPDAPNGYALRSWSASTSTSNDALRSSTTVCVGCVGASARGHLSVGPNVHGTSQTGTLAGAGLLAEGWVEIHAAALRLAHSSSVELGDEHLGGEGSLQMSATVGGEANAHGLLQATPHAQDLTLEAGAVAGAQARAEERAAVHLVGASLEETAAVEGWAGAGVHGSLHVSHTGGRFELRHSLGAALGLGGAYDVGVTLDLSHLKLDTSKAIVASSLALLSPVDVVATWGAQRLVGGIFGKGSR